MFDGLCDRSRCTCGAVDAPLVRMSAVIPHPAVAPPATGAVWRQYDRSRDPALRDRLVFTLAPLVRHAGASTDTEASAGLVALGEAIDDYVPDRDGGLELFAWTRIRGALSSVAP
jgi:hypothetical protein